MGKVLSCERCDLSSSTSVFTFSEPLVLKLTEGIQPEPEKEVPGKSRDMDDREWMEKLSCIDTVHTQVYGLYEEGFQMLLDRVAKELELQEDSALYFEKQKIKECYQKYPECSLNCDKTVSEFMERIDVKRLEAMIRQVNESEKE